MAMAKVPLLTATEMAVNANAGPRMVGIVPELKNGQAIAEVTFFQGMTFKNDGEARPKSGGLGLGTLQLRGGTACGCICDSWRS
jgi:hypothetical protein